MKRATAAGILLLAAAQAVWAADIDWKKNYSEAQKIAKETGKPMVLLFGVGASGRSC